jgi:hypothetical protein
MMNSRNPYYEMTILLFPIDTPEKMATFIGGRARYGSFSRPRSLPYVSGMSH